MNIVIEPLLPLPLLHLEVLVVAGFVITRVVVAVWQRSKRHVVKYTLAPSMWQLCHVTMSLSTQRLLRHWVVGCQWCLMLVDASRCCSWGYFCHSVWRNLNKFQKNNNAKTIKNETCIGRTLFKPEPNISNLNLRFEFRFTKYLNRTSRCRFRFNLTPKPELNRTPASLLGDQD